MCTSRARMMRHTVFLQCCVLSMAHEQDRHIQLSLWLKAPLRMHLLQLRPLCAERVSSTV